LHTFDFAQVTACVLALKVEVMSVSILKGIITASENIQLSNLALSTRKATIPFTEGIFAA
jgi:hypothetical protein